MQAVYIAYLRPRVTCVHIRILRKIYDMNKYQPIIGLEIHVELKTNSKMFCGCPADWFGKPPNSNNCPVCLGLPGALPVPNKKAIEWTIKIAKALNCQINKVSKFDRKNYFYPDLPKAYQISQYDAPIGVHGNVKFKIQSSKFKVEDKNIKITRVHLEEDTGKLLHQGADTLVDFNRSGVPLVEIVTEPDFRNSDDCKLFLEELQTILRYLDVSDCDMEKGSMRVEPNISLSNFKVQSSNVKFVLPSYKVEVKNINSFRYAKYAIDYEIERQAEILDSGQTPVQETRGFNENKNITFSQRVKEEAHDYRYFPEPDIPPMIFSQKFLEEIKVPELPSQRVNRYINEFKLRYQDAFILTRHKDVAFFFEAVNSKFKMQNSKLDLKIKNHETKLASLMINKKISSKLSADEFINKAIDLLTPKLNNETQIKAIIDKIIQENPKPVADYKKGKTNVLMFLVGQVMKEMKGKADANVIMSALKNKI